MPLGPVLRPGALPRPRGRGRRVVPDPVLGALWILFGCYVVGLALHGKGFEPLVDGWLGSLTTALPALVSLDAGRRLRGTAGSRELLLLGAGALAWSLGGIYVVFVAAQGQELPFPS